METVGLSNLSMFGAPGMPTVGAPAPLLDTGQIAAYSFFDDGSYELGVDKGYTVNAIAGNSLIQVAHYAATTISFTAPDILADAANGLVTFLTGDTIVVKGSPANNGTYVVSNGATADHFHVAPNVVNEGAGAVVSLYKQTTHSNAVVQDNKTGRMWSRNTSVGERVGAASTGSLNFYDAATRFTLYNVANTISVIMPGNILRIAGGAALTQFHVGDCIMAAGFANPVNLLPNLYVVSAVANAGDLDITVNPGNEVLIAEGAVGDTIYLNCRSIFNYMAGARLAGLSGYSDWRIPNDVELPSLRDMEAPTGYPDGVAFPVWTSNYVQTSTTTPSAITWNQVVYFPVGTVQNHTKISADPMVLVRL